MPSPKPQSSASTTRRGFMKSSSMVAGGVLAGTLAAPRTVHAAGSDVIKVGVVGCGGRGKGAAKNVMQADPEGVKIIAMADAFRGRIEGCLQQLSRRQADQLDVPEDRRFSGLEAYKQVMASDCDVVILATPPGFRPYHFEAAVNAGKHVFMEKPVAVDPAGIRKVLDVAKKAKEKSLAVGVGLQRRHNPDYITAVKRLQDGVIGDICFSKVYWNSGGVWVRSRADFANTFGHEPTELEYQVNNWYYFNWLCGDHIVEQHIHNLDVSNWVRGMHPAKANGMGGREVRTGKDHGQIFDHHFVEFTYPDDTTMISQCRHQKDCWSAVKEDFFGDNGSGELRDGRPCVVHVGNEQLKHDGPKLDAYLQEHIDLLESIRSGNPYNEAEYGATSTMTSILGRMATYSGRPITWEEAMQSNLQLAPVEMLAWDATPPVTPDASGRYEVPVPGKTLVV